MDFVVSIIAGVCITRETTDGSKLCDTLLESSLSNFVKHRTEERTRWVPEKSAFRCLGTVKSINHRHCIVLESLVALSERVVTYNH